MLEAMLGFIGIGMKPSHGDIVRDQNSVTINSQLETIAFWQGEAESLDAEVKEIQVENAKLTKALKSADDSEWNRLEQLREKDRIIAAKQEIIDARTEQVKKLRETFEEIVSSLRKLDQTEFTRVSRLVDSIDS